MHGMPFFIPDEDHPQKLIVHPDVIVITDEVVEGRIRWSRFVQGTYLPVRGFLTTHAERRINLRVYTRDEGTRQFTPCYDEARIATELNAFVIPGTLTVIHYVPGSKVDCLIVGLPMDTEDLLPAQYKVSYPRLCEG